ncbi:MAG: hypothetical protein Q8Q14_10340, partial [Gemmatimonadales bacterium]|nr:hypothetical protein [Gemmatimonadales bacterium]
MKRSLYALGAVLVAACQAGAAQGNRPAAPAPAARDSTPGSFKKFADIVRGATHRPGLFDTYQKGDNLYLVI